MTKWRGDDRYPLPNDPDLLTRAWWWLEDHWRSLDRVDRHSILIILGVILFCLCLRFLGN